MGKLFNHNVFGELGRIQGLDVTRLGVEDYPGRALGLTSPGDVIQLSPAIRHGWEWIQAHYQRIGVSCTSEVVWDDRFQVAHEFPQHELSVFVFSPEVHQVRPDEGWLGIAMSMGAKNGFVSWCHQLNVPMPKTWCYNSLSEMNGAKFKYPVFVKMSTSASGWGIVRCQGESELSMRLGSYSSCAFQVQEEVQAEAFPNLIYEVRDGIPHRIVATRQVLTGYEHDGNIYPTGLEDPWEMADRLAEAMVSRGMKGAFGFDFAMTAKGPLAIECNARFNGSNYPAEVARKLCLNSWKARNFKTKCRRFDPFDEFFRKVEYNPVTKTGIVVVNWGCINQGKLGVLISGNAEEQRALEERFQALCP